MRRWLTLYALSITSIVILAFSIPLAVLIRDLAADRAINAAETEAQTVARFAATIGGGPESLAALEATLGGAEQTSVVLPDGTVVGSALTPGIDLTPATERGQAYRQQTGDGQAVIVPIFRAQEPPWVIVIGLPRAALTENVATAWAILALLAAALIGLAFFVADRMGRAVVRPVVDLVSATQRLGQGDLDASVEPSGPNELVMVGTAFNTLTGRVRSLLDHERETAADLSHRLRTPLTALKLDVEAAGRTTDVSRLERDVDDLERAVGHVISEARRSVREGGGVISDLSEVVTERATYWGNLAEDQDRAWKLDVQDGAFPVVGSNSDLAAMLDALLGNVFQHTPAGTDYRVSLRRAPGGIAELAVADDGPGIGDPTLLERGSSGAESTGLGADIVSRTAQAAGGTAEWSSGDPSGTLVRVSIPMSRLPR